MSKVIDRVARETEAGYGIAPAGYRLPADAHVGRVRLQVADLERSLAWYVRVLGFRVLSRDAGRATLAAHGDGTPLVELHERPGAAPVPHRGRLGLYHYAILLPDRAALGRFVTHLGEVGERFGASDHLVSEATYLHDPDGLGIEVYADRPRSAWRADGRELRMDTTPMNLREVIAAGRGERWTGMPAGTTIGHVHLHVGDLERAAAFYHAALGLDLVVWSYPSALFLSAGGYHHHLGLNTWAGPAARPPAEGEARLLEWGLVVPTASDAEAAARSLAEAGFAAEAGRATDPWGTALRIVTPS
ncbi:MAG TPA: VOC family protein [Longimicrobiaceae bacterium]